MTKPILIILRMVDSNQPHMEKLRFILLMVDEHIRMSMPEINYEDYFTPVKELADDSYGEVPGEYGPPEYL